MGCNNPGTSSTRSHQRMKGVRSPNPNVRNSNAPFQLQEPSAPAASDLVLVGRSCVAASAPSVLRRAACWSPGSKSSPAFAREILSRQLRLGSKGARRWIDPSVRPTQKADPRKANEASMPLAGIHTCANCALARSTNTRTYAVLHGVMAVPNHKRQPSVDVKAQARRRVVFFFVGSSCGETPSPPHTGVTRMSLLTGAAHDTTRFKHAY